MTTTPTAAAPASQRQRRRPRVLLTILELAGLGLAGSLVMGLITAFIGAGIGLLFVIGLGLFVLAGVVYALYAVAWFERERVSALYTLDVPPLRRNERSRPGFGGWLRALAGQAVDGPMWRALASFALASIAGAVILRLFHGLAWSAAMAVTPATAGEQVAHPYLFGGSGIDSAWAPLVGILGFIVSAAGIVGIALLMARINQALVSPSRAAKLSAQVKSAGAQRAGAVRAADVERTRIERDLHDGVQPRLVSVGMTLGLAQQKIDSDPDAARELISEAHTSTKAAITELRQLARGIHTAVLDDRGLDAALSALAGRSHIPVQLDVRIDPVPGSGQAQNSPSGAESARCRDAEAAVYFVVAESLTNAAKHSRASECRVVVRSREGSLWARVEDNGIGGASAQPGGGIDGLTNRVLAAGGTLRLDSPVGGPTSLEVSVPCAS